MGQRTVSPAARLLREAGVTQAQLGEKLGVRQRAVSFYLSGKRGLPKGFRKKLEALTSRGKATKIVEAIRRG